MKINVKQFNAHDLGCFPAYLITKVGKEQLLEKVNLTLDDLMPGDVVIRVEWTTLNYKDGLALTGSAPVIKQFPLIPGIDFAGTVLYSQNARFCTGDQVVLNGFSVGESHYGGYAGVARVNADWLIKLPDSFNTRQAMAIGTAGYTAMLCVMALQRHGIQPSDGNILVTGATGGVGSMAIMILSRLGYRVIALTGRSEHKGFLQLLGAAEIVDRNALNEPAKPLAKTRWIGAIDVAGGHILANVISQLSYAGAVAACGLASAMQLPTSVAPFILRGVTLYGIDSVMASIDKRQAAWQALAQHVDEKLLEYLTTEVSFDALPDKAAEIVQGRLRGRLVIPVNA